MKILGIEFGPDFEDVLLGAGVMVGSYFLKRVSQSLSDKSLKRKIRNEVRACLIEQKEGGQE